jgi:hypothetical protein
MEGWQNDQPLYATVRKELTVAAFSISTLYSVDWLDDSE